MNPLVASIVTLSALALLHFWAIPWLRHREPLEDGWKVRRWVAYIAICESLWTIGLIIAASYALLLGLIFWAFSFPNELSTDSIDALVANASRWQKIFGTWGLSFGLAGIVVSLVLIIYASIRKYWLEALMREKNKLEKSLKELSQLHTRVVSQSSKSSSELNLGFMDHEIAKLYRKLQIIKSELGNSIIENSQNHQSNSSWGVQFERLGSSIYTMFRSGRKIVATMGGGLLCLSLIAMEAGNVSNGLQIAVAQLKIKWAIQKIQVKDSGHLPRAPNIKNEKLPKP